MERTDKPAAQGFCRQVARAGGPAPGARLHASRLSLLPPGFCPPSGAGSIQLLGGKRNHLWEVGKRQARGAHLGGTPIPLAISQE